MRLTYLSLAVALGCSGPSSPKAQAKPPTSPTAKPQLPASKNEITTASGLKYRVLKEGTAAKPVRGQKISVHYTGRLENGKVFDSSVLQERPPLQFPVGVGRVIKGWDEALLDMRLGEKRLLTIPSHLAYGARSIPNLIPAHSTLIFEVELVGLLEMPRGMKAQPAANTAPKTKASTP